MRNYCLKIQNMSKWRYKELKAYRMQYPEWKHEADKLLDVQGKEISDMPRANTISNPTEVSVEKREKYLKKIEVIEVSIDEACQELDHQKRAIKTALINNMCYGETLKILHKKTRYLDYNSFYITRRKAFNNLDLRLVKND